MILNNKYFFIYFFTLFFFFSFMKHVIALERFESIIGTIDDKAITSYDIDQRIKILLKSIQLKDNIENRDIVRKRAFELLIEEVVKLNEAEKEKISIPQKDVEEFMKQAFGFSKDDKNTFLEFLKNDNIDYEVLEEQIKIELMWKKLVNQKLSSRIIITPEKISSMVNEYNAKAGKKQYNYSEIVILKKKRSIQELKASINKIKNILSQDVSFESVANKFSESPSSLVGGNLGWIFEEQIKKKVLNNLKKLEKKTKSNFIQFDDSFKMFKLNDLRTLGIDNEKKYSLISFSVISPKTDVNLLKKKVNDCDQEFNTLLTEDDVEFNKIDNVFFKDLPSKTQKMLDNKFPGDTTDVINQNGTNFFLLICDIKGGNVVKVNESLIENKYFQDRLRVLSRTYLNKLRRKSNINLNIK